MKNSVSANEFQLVMSGRKSCKIGDLLFLYEGSKQSKISFIVSRKYGNAVQRNLFKRRCKFMFSEVKKSKLPSMILIVRPLTCDIRFRPIKLAFAQFNEKVAN